MKTISILIILSIFFNTNSSFANSLKIYIIEPKFEIKWDSPSSLAVSTGLNSIQDDYAPIGHFAIEINCSPNKSRPFNHVITGMERKNKKESQRITLKEGLGLGSLIYSFKGALQTSMNSIQEIQKARNEKRLKTLEIMTSQQRCESMLDYLDLWIESGSYQVYGGGKKTEFGEGAGCADFAMHFFKIATNQEPNQNWTAKVNIPKSLIGNKNEKVNFISLLTRNDWALPHENQLPFKIADTNLVSKWLNKFGTKCGDQYFWHQHVIQSNSTNSDCSHLKNEVKNSVESLPIHSNLPFRFTYPSTIYSKSIWKSISIE